MVILLADAVVVNLGVGSIGQGGLRQAVVGVVLIAGRQRLLRAFGESARDGLRELVVVGVVGVGTGVAEGIDLAGEIALAVVAKVVVPFSGSVTEATVPLEL